METRRREVRASMLVSCGDRTVAGRCGLWFVGLLATAAGEAACQLCQHISHQVQASRSSATGLKGAQTYSTNSKKV